MLVIDKPAGLAVHASGRTDNHLGLHLDQLRFGLPVAPELAHRLDRDTSGCLVLGRHHRALRRLGALFANRRVEKTYWAVVEGAPPGDSGTIDQPLAKLGPPWNWRVKVAPSGQPALTDWRLLGRGGGVSWIECRPRTGRTHQLRVHLAALGCPIVGDAVYGRSGPHLLLHARAVAVPLYPGRAPIAVVAPVPPHLAGALAGCGWPGEELAPTGEEPQPA